MHRSRINGLLIDCQTDNIDAAARFWAEALNLGAYDLLAQPFYEPEVRRILSNACSRPSYRASAASAAPV